MSGVEVVAGLVLAGFPLVISGIEAYRNGLKRLQIWWQYRTQVLELGEAVESQHIIFLANIEVLLDPIVTSSLQMDRLLKSTGTGDPEWEDSKLAEKLRQRLSTSYNSYMNTVKKMSETLKKLESQLGIVAGKVTPNAPYDLTTRFHKTT